MICVIIFSLNKNFLLFYVINKYIVIICFLLDFGLVVGNIERNKNKCGFCYYRI